VSGYTSALVIISVSSGCVCTVTYFWQAYLTFFWPQLHLWYSTLKQYPLPPTTYLSTSTLRTRPYALVIISLIIRHFLSLGHIWINTYITRNLLVRLSCAPPHKTSLCRCYLNHDFQLSASVSCQPAVARSTSSHGRRTSQPLGTVGQSLRYRTSLRTGETSNSTVTVNVRSVQRQFQHKSSVTLRSLSQPCRSVHMAGCPR